MTDYVTVCANCHRPYEKHLLWDGNKCSLGSINGWFPKEVEIKVSASSFFKDDAIGFCESAKTVGRIAVFDCGLCGALVERHQMHAHARWHVLDRQELAAQSK